jgi:hypothetical protein
MQDGRISPESEHPANSPATSLIFSHRTIFEEITSLFPDSREDCYLLLGTFLTNVDPMLRLLHKGTIIRKFDQFVTKSFSSKSSGGESPDSKHDSFNSLAMAIFFSAVNSMTSVEVIRNFQISKSDMLERFKRGTELCLERDDFLSSDSIETLQAFVVLLVHIFQV